MQCANVLYYPTRYLLNAPYFFWRCYRIRWLPGFVGKRREWKCLHQSRPLTKQFLPLCCPSLLCCLAFLAWQHYWSHVLLTQRLQPDILLSSLTYSLCSHPSYHVCFTSQYSYYYFSTSPLFFSSVFPLFCFYPHQYLLVSQWSGWKFRSRSLNS